MEVQHILDLVSTFLDKLMKRLNSMKKVRVDGSELSQAVSDILTVIQRVNQLGMYDTTIPEWDNRSIDEIEIPSEFSQMVLPSSVRFNAGDIRSKELLVKPAESKLPNDLSFFRFNTSVSKLRSVMKRDSRDGLVTIGSLRKAVSLSDVIDRFFVVRKNKIMAKLSSDTNLPIELIDDVDHLFEDDFYNTRDVNRVIEDFTNSIIF